MTVLDAVAPLRGASGPLCDARVEAVIARVQAERSRPADGGPLRNGEFDPQRHADFDFSIHPEQGELIYLLCRALRAKRVVEFATSIGLSTLYFAAAKRNLDAAGLSEFVEIRQGDARETLRDLGGEIDFTLIDGRPGGAGDSLALQVMRIVAPQMQGGAIALNDNAESDYLAYVRNPRNGFRSMSLPLKGGTELSVKSC